MGRSQSLELLHSLELELLNCFCLLIPSNVVKNDRKKDSIYPALHCSWSLRDVPALRLHPALECKRFRRC